jgi:hypothetical protein
VETPASRILAEVFNLEELNIIEKLLAQERHESIEDTAELRDICRRLNMVQEFLRTGKPELEEFLVLVRRPE